jgi:uncharacterized protein YlxW (UPF0749 family)
MILSTQHQVSLLPSRKQVRFHFGCHIILKCTLSIICALVLGGLSIASDSSEFTNQDRPESEPQSKATLESQIFLLQQELHILNRRESDLSNQLNSIKSNRTLINRRFESKKVIAELEKTKESLTNLKVILESTSPIGAPQLRSALQRCRRKIGFCDTGRERLS